MLTYSNYFPGNIFFPLFLFHVKHSIFLYLFFYSDLFYFSKYILSTYLFFQIISREIFFPPFLFHVKHSILFYIYFFIRTYFIFLNIYYLLTYLFKLFPGKYFFSTALVSCETFYYFLFIFLFGLILFL